ncbi:UNVERIFIED_ORG: hypothetical protein HNP28_003669 [Comamonas terrigena]
MAKATHNLAPERRPGENGYKYRQQFGLVIICKDETDQQKTFAKLVKQGYSPKVVCV